MPKLFRTYVPVGLLAGALTYLLLRFIAGWSYDAWAFSHDPVPFSALVSLGAMYLISIYTPTALALRPVKAGSYELRAGLASLAFLATLPLAASVGVITYNFLYLVVGMWQFVSAFAGILAAVACLTLGTVAIRPDTVREGHIPAPADTPRRVPGQPSRPSPAPNVAPLNSRLVGEVIILSRFAIDQAQGIAENVFRPMEEDVETKYAMLGQASNQIDRAVVFASDQVIKEVTPTRISYDRSRLLEFLRRSGASHSSIIVDVHTHPSRWVLPSQHCMPSEMDKDSWRRMAVIMAREFPHATFLCGIHATRLHQELLHPTTPRQTRPNAVSWNSVTRSHEIALFTPDAQPVDVAFYTHG